jgi:hypothetical protein
VLDEYKPKRLLESDRLDRAASARFDQGKDANQDSDSYVLATIFFAAVLFFAGLSSKFKSNRVAILTLGFGTIVFLGGLCGSARCHFTRPG